MVTIHEICQMRGRELGKSTFFLLLARRKETAVSFNSNGDNPLNKLKFVNICGRYEHSCVIKELIFFGDGFP